MKLLRTVLALMLAAMLALPVAASAQTFPERTGRVVDAANILSPEQEAALTQQSAGLEARTGHQFVIVTVASLEGEPIESYALALANDWGIGRAGIDDGMLLLVAPNERRVRIETGPGLLGKLPNTEAERIIREEILPEFREGRLPEGIAKGADAIVARLSEGGQ